MAIEKPKKPFGVYHWDTFEPPGKDTFLVAEADTADEAIKWVQANYGDQIRSRGAARVQVVEFNDRGEGTLVAKFNVGHLDRPVRIL